MLLLICLFIPGIFAETIVWHENGYKMKIVNGTLKSIKNIDYRTNHLVINNTFTAIHQMAFKNVGNLESISVITPNTLEILPPLVFLPLENLTHLSLRNNVKISSTKNVFIGLNKLRTLDLTGVLHQGSDISNFNGISVSVFIINSPGRILIQNIPGSRVIDPYRPLCLKRGIVQFLQQADDVEKLRFLSKNCTDVHLIDNSKFSHGTCDLRENNITGFRKDWYRLDGSMTHLKLDDNNITVFSFQILNQLPSTTISVTLRRNGLKALRRGVIINKYLKSLDLSDNFIAEIEDYALKNVKLTSLYLTKNQLSNNKFVETMAPGLERLGLYRNNISKLFSNAFIHMNTLTALDLGGNKLKTLDENAFNGLENVEHFSIGGNTLTNITADSFRGLPAALATSLYVNRTTIELHHHL